VANLKLGANLRLIVSFDPCAPNKPELYLTFRSRIRFLKKIGLGTVSFMYGSKTKIIPFYFL
jgi:hypothetical protein